MANNTNNWFGFGKPNSTVGRALVRDTSSKTGEMENSQWTNYRSPNQSQLFEDYSWKSRVELKLRFQSEAIRNPKPIPGFSLQGQHPQSVPSWISLTPNSQGIPPSLPGGSSQGDVRPCDVCKIMTFDLKDHVERCHVDGANPNAVRVVVVLREVRAVSCSYCNFGTGDKRQLQKHLSTYHVDQLRRSYRRK